MAGETVWTGFGARFADDFFGRSTFSVEVATEFPVGTDHQRTFTGVAHPYVAEPADLQGNQAPPGAGAGPVEYLELSTLDAGVLDANSRATSDPPLASVIVTVGLQPPFQIQSPLEEPVVLRVASPSGSQNQAFDCDRPFNFQTEIEIGCRTTYRENYGDWDNDGDMEWPDILCADYPNGIGLPPDTSTPSPPPDCVRVETGDKVGQFRHGIDLRLKTPSCATNNWPDALSDFPDFFTNHDFVNDPRYVTLIITDYETFLGAGSSPRFRSSTSRASTSPAGTRRPTTLPVPTTSHIRGTRPDIEEASTTATSGATSSTSSRFPRPERAVMTYATLMTSAPALSVSSSSDLTTSKAYWGKASERASSASRPIPCEWRRRAVGAIRDLTRAGRERDRGTRWRVG